MMSTPLSTLTILTLAANVPGPVAAARLRDLGARVIKVEPPFGDPLAVAGADWYADLHRDVDVRVLDLKDTVDRGELDRLLAQADLLLTSNRPSALARLGLDVGDGPRPLPGPVLCGHRRLSRRQG